MTNSVIKVEGLGKKYQIGGTQESYKTLRDTLSGAITAPFRRLPFVDRGKPSPPNETIWALRDVSFNVDMGEVLGIVGRNGAGKSTLLKILSRITHPTEGLADVRGRVGSLLEVGTGFHAELTGRENIFLNGAILGMKRSEIERKYDEIVAFSEVEKFLDTPVKRYSSGMYMRLAFAVAAHLDPEILLVDEVLAVGDWDFQKKCLGKMGDVSREGRAVLLVSHNMASIMNLCSRAVLLDEGRLVMDDQASKVVQHYIAARPQSGSEVVWESPEKAIGDENVRLHAIRVLTENGEPTTELDIAKDILIEIEFWNLHAGGKLYPSMQLKDDTGAYVLSSPNLPSASSTVDPLCGQRLPEGLFKSTCRIPGGLLNDRTYTLDVVINERSGFYGGAYALGILMFHVFDSGHMRKEHLRDWPGVVRPRLSWFTEEVQSPS